MAEDTMTYESRHFNVQEECDVGFCIRHGVVDVLAKDRVCFECNASFKGIEHIPIPHEAHSCDSSSEEEEEENDKEENNSPITDEFETSPTDRPLEPRQRSLVLPTSTNLTEHQLDGLLEQLQASELALASSSSVAGTARPRSASRPSVPVMDPPPLKPLARRQTKKKKKKPSPASRLQQSESVERLSKAPETIEAHHLRVLRQRHPTSSSMLRWEVQNAVSTTSKGMLRHLSKAEKARKKRDKRVRREIRQVQDQIQQLLNHAH